MAVISSWRRNVHTLVLLLVVTYGICVKSTSAAEDIITQVSHDDDIREPPGVVAPPASDIPNEVFKADETLILPCSARGIPKPKYTWLKDGKELHFGGMEFTGQDGYIMIRNAGILHQGQYQCVAHNKWGKSLSRIYKLRRSVLGDFPGEKIVREFTGNVGWWLVINRLAVKSDPPPVYTWKIVEDVNDDTPRAVTSNRRVVSDIEGNLYFTSLEKEDSLSSTGSFYKVDVRNSLMDLTAGGSYSKVIVNEGKRQAPVATLIFPESKKTTIVVLEGEPIKLNCIFGGVKGGDPDIKWSRATSGLISDYGTRLTIEKATLADKGPYTCTGENSHGSDMGLFDVDVQTIPKFTAKGHPQGQTLSEGDTAHFICQVTKDTDPMATITWMINTAPMNEQQPGKRTDLRNIENGKEMIITHLKRDDIKVIQCSVSNKHSTLYADAPLNVLLLTVQTVSPTEARVMTNHTGVNFSCLATTDPSTQLTVKWSRDGKPLIYYDDSRMVEVEGALIIDLGDLDPESLVTYEGRYGCNASNGHSFDYNEARLIYTPDTPDPSASPIVGAISNLWLIILLIVLLLLIVIFFLICCGCCLRNKGDSYYVDEKERATGNDPVADEKLAGFHDYVRPPVAKRKDSRASLTSTVFMGSTCSLDFGTVSEPGISEDGSFLGLYGTNK